jgi:hypothetical protein
MLIRRALIRCVAWVGHPGEYTNGSIAALPNVYEGPEGRRMRGFTSGPFQEVYPLFRLSIREVALKALEKKLLSE